MFHGNQVTQKVLPQEHMKSNAWTREDGLMTSDYEQGSTLKGAAKPNWAGFPNTSAEFITLIAHYYRAEIARMAGWRDRIDRTSNWAITVVGAMLSVSLSTPTAHHGVILFAMVLVLLLLVIDPPLSVL